MKLSRNIDIGSLEAEDDDLLLESFVFKDDYNALIKASNQKCVLLGRTGVGKSALIRRIITESEYVTQIHPEEMSLKYLSNSEILEYFRRLGINLDLFYKVLWKHVFIVEILKLYFGEDKVKSTTKFQSVVESVTLRFNKKKKEALDYVRTWKDSFWEKTEYRIRELDEKLLESFRLKVGVDAKLFDEFVGANIGAEANEVIQRSKKTDVINKAQSVVNEIQLNEIGTILDIIHKDLLPNTQKRYYIVIDDLDKEWVDRKIVYDLIVALINCIKEVNNCPNIKIIVALRLNLQQLALQKATTRGFQREKFANMFFHLYWSEDELEELLQKRIITLYRSAGEMAPRLSDLLPKDPGRGGKKDGFTYMLNRSFYRPRDIISFFNKALKHSNGGTKITRNAIHLAESEYSIERLNAIEDEWHENIPYIRAYFSVLRNLPQKLKERDISYGKVRSFCLNVHKRAKSRDLKNITRNGWDRKKIWKTKTHIINTLYKIGCIGIKQTSEHQTLYSFHQNNALDSVYLTKDVTIYVNPSLHKALMIKNELHQGA